MKRIVVFTSDLNYAVRKGIIELLCERPALNILVMCHCPPKNAKRILRNQWRNLNKHGWRWITYQSLEILKLIATWLRPAKRRAAQRPGSEYRVESLQSERRIRIEVFDDIHDSRALDCALAFAPDLGISLAAPILKRCLFEIPRLGSINLHKGSLPAYRGMPPAFWELWNDENSVGCTIHIIAAGLDTGSILVSDNIARQPFSTVRGLQLMLDELGIRLTCEAVSLITEGNARPRRQIEGGRTYRKPKLAQAAKLMRQLNRPKRKISGRAVVKEIATVGYLFALRPLIRLYNYLFDKREIIVLLYHRVSDEFRDAVTVGIEQFDQQINYLAEHYTVTTVDEIIHDRVPKAKRGRPIIAVTFDDGYRDNYEIAVPILLRHEIPAAFFVSTGFIGSETGFDHDLQKLGRSLPNMNWNQIREMRDCGFAIGSHTVSHINCSDTGDMELRKELVESKSRLQEELGLVDVYFAYPFGKRRDMTPRALDIVKKEGYKACFSAYGGVNRGPINRFNVLRMGISCGFKFNRFVARLEGW